MISQKIFLFGASGHLGCFLKKEFKKNNFEVYCPTRNDVANILNDNFIEDDYRNAYLFNVVGIVGSINSSVFKDNLSNINSNFPLKLSQLCRKSKSKLIHISSNSIFDNCSNRFRDKNQIPNSNTNYGISKLKAEENIVNNLDLKRYLILRTPQHYSNNLNNKRNLLSGIYHKLKVNKKIEIYKNEIFSISSCHQISRCILKLITEDYFGIFHACEVKEYTWVDIASIIARKLDLDINKSVYLKYANTIRMNNTLVPCTQTKLESDLEILNFK